MLTCLKSQEQGSCKQHVSAEAAHRTRKQRRLGAGLRDELCGKRRERREGRMRRVRQRVCRTLRASRDSYAEEGRQD